MLSDLLKFCQYFQYIPPTLSLLQKHEKKFFEMRDDQIKRTVTAFDPTAGFWVGGLLYGDSS
jgi:hypothetical protein